MKLEVSLNPKKESYDVSAFVQSLAGWEHPITLIYGPEDMLDPTAEPSLENLTMANLHRVFVDRIIYVDGNNIVELYCKPEINKPVPLRRKKKHTYP